MLIAITPILAAIIGLLMYVLESNPKVSEIGRLLFFAGILVSLFIAGEKTVKLP